MDSLTFHPVYKGEVLKNSASAYIVENKFGDVMICKGSGFKYDKNGLFTAGTITSFTLITSANQPFYAENVKISAKQFGLAIKSASTEDDQALMLKALSGNDSVSGSEDGDVLYAAAGDDVIEGNGGNDYIYAGPGADHLYGGYGKDSFGFNDISQSGTTAKTRDTIFDFSQSEKDRINLSYIDANTKTSKNDSFSFIGTKAFSGKAGELRYEKKTSDTYIYADVNGDKKADFSIHLDDAVKLVKGDFFL